MRTALGRLSVLIDQSLQAQQEINILALDATKACPNVNRQTVVALLKLHGYPENIIAVTKVLYNEGRTAMRYGGSVVNGDTFAVERGIHQGCSVSVLAFNILLSSLCEKLEPRWSGGLEQTARNLQQSSSHIGFFADGSGS